MLACTWLCITRTKINNTPLFLLDPAWCFKLASPVGVWLVWRRLFTFSLFYPFFSTTKNLVKWWALILGDSSPHWALLMKLSPQNKTGKNWDASQAFLPHLLPFTLTPHQSNQPIDIRRLLLSPLDDSKKLSLVNWQVIWQQIPKCLSCERFFFNVKATNFIPSLFHLAHAQASLLNKNTEEAKRTLKLWGQQVCAVLAHSAKLQRIS